MRSPPFPTLQFSPPNFPDWKPPVLPAAKKTKPG